jgi:hypothetical protein
VKMLRAIFFLIGAMAAGPAFASQAPSQPIEVMVVGTWHFAGSERDLVSFRTDDVRLPHRQSELEAIAAAIAEFRPTRIMVERVAPAADLLDPAFASFTREMLTQDRNERVQIGYRLANRLGHRVVYAIDEQPSAGEPDYFPFDRLVEHDRANGAGDLPQRVQAQVAQMARDFNEKQATRSLPALLAEWNTPRWGEEWLSSYYQFLSVGDADNQPGAELNALYYMRNAKIFAKLMTVARPGDRIVVVYGAGHSYWLRHFAVATPGFRNVDPTPYLQRAARRL